MLVRLQTGVSKLPQAVRMQGSANMEVVRLGKHSAELC